MVDLRGNTVPKKMCGKNSLLLLGYLDGWMSSPYIKAKNVMPDGYYQRVKIITSITNEFFNALYYVLCKHFNP